MTPNEKNDFIREIIDEDLKTNKFEGRVHTRFPPEPNGYLHIGHAKSIRLNYGIAKDYAGKFNLRFDDTNPEKEEQEYVDSIIEDVKWLGGDFEDRLFYASDYFEQMYQYAVALIKKGKAYVCDLSADEIRMTRGTLTEPGKESPYRNRTVEENLLLFEHMRKGEISDGTKTVRAKIDMASPNINLRDPIMYRSFMKDTTDRETHGVSIRRTTGRMALRIPLKESRTPSARSNLRIIVLCTIGSSTNWVFIIHSKLSLHG